VNVFFVRNASNERTNSAALSLSQVQWDSLPEVFVAQPYLRVNESSGDLRAIRIIQVALPRPRGLYQRVNNHEIPSGVS
jgi:hypothetical protein